METDTAEQLNAIGDTASATVRQVALSHLVTQHDMYKMYLTNF